MGTKWAFDIPERTHLNTSTGDCFSAIKSNKVPLGDLFTQLTLSLAALYRYGRCFDLLVFSTRQATQLATPVYRPGRWSSLWPTYQLTS
ncbi:hypothetical protein TYRP_019337 [Tyrophagus putrescentiae]|nr:hypothetical protein TYRP_019337 [Tyrophagus putrescentiae]